MRLCDILVNFKRIFLIMAEYVSFDSGFSLVLFCLHYKPSSLLKHFQESLSTFPRTSLKIPWNLFKFLPESF